MLLNRGAQINAEDLLGTTLLHFAAEYKIIDSIELLLSRGANVDAKNKDGKTALHIASEERSIEIVEHLLNYGADINCTCSSNNKFRVGYTPLHLAVERHCEEIVKLLLSRGVNVDTKGRNDTIALQIASEEGSIEIVEHLLNYGADINCTCISIITDINYACMSINGCTPLHLAVENYSDEIIELFLRRGANVDAKRKDGTTALHIASERGYTEIVKHLLNHGANVNCRYTSMYRVGFTPLHLAVEKYEEEVMKLLLNKGANVKAKGKNGRTALHIAFDNGCIHFTNILKRHAIRMEITYSYVSKKNISIKSNDESDKDFCNECEKQIAIIKSEKFNNTNVSFYDILTKGHNINQLAVYARNKNIVQVLRSKDYEIKFPIYASMINSNFIKGETRRELLEQSNKIFHFFFFNNFRLPLECTEEIFSYLSNEDLRILIDTY